MTANRERLYTVLYAACSVAIGAGLGETLRRLITDQPVRTLPIAMCVVGVIIPFFLKE
jgi:hypothetical protein